MSANELSVCSPTIAIDAFRAVIAMHEFSLVRLFKKQSPTHMSAPWVHVLFLFIQTSHIHMYVQTTNKYINKHLHIVHKFPIKRWHVYITLLWTSWASEFRDISYWHNNKHCYMPLVFTHLHTIYIFFTCIHCVHVYANNRWWLN